MVVTAATMSMRRCRWRPFWYVLCFSVVYLFIYFTLTYFCIIQCSRKKGVSVRKQIYGDDDGNHPATHSPTDWLLCFLNVYQAFLFVLACSRHCSSDDVLFRLRSVGCWFLVCPIGWPNNSWIIVIILHRRSNLFFCFCFADSPINFGHPWCCGLCVGERGTSIVGCSSWGIQKWLRQRRQRCGSANDNSFGLCCAAQYFIYFILL